MKCIETKDAVGQILCHDITQIIRGEHKGPVFRKGHVIKEEDIPVLLSVGKDHVYIWDSDESMMHENDAAEVLCRIARGNNIMRGDVKEGKIELFAECSGVFKINRKELLAVNSFGEMMIAVRHGDRFVRKGDKLAGTRIIPLTIEKEKMERLESEMTDGAVLNVLPLKKKQAGIVTTGNEIYYGRIKDTFTPVVESKLREFGSEVTGHKYSDDRPEHIEAAIRELLESGCDLIICTGGMSVDPDDQTPLAIRNVTGKVVSYGAPVLPGAMFLLAYYSDRRIPVIGLPGCVMYSERTIFDLLLPRILADDPISREDLNDMGEGGLCLDCDVCVFPNCGFGR